MDIEKLRDYCMAKPAVTECFPFDESTLVFKVQGKIFLLTDLIDEFAMNIKNYPEKILEQREQYNCVQPGYHMNKKYWNTVILDGSVSDNRLQEWIDESYSSVVKGLSKKEKEEFVKAGGDIQLIYNK